VKPKEQKGGSEREKGDKYNLSPGGEEKGVRSRPEIRKSYHC